MKTLRCSRHAYEVQKVLHKEFPSCVPKPIEWKNGILKTEWTSGVSTCDTKAVIKNVRRTLEMLRKKFPGFRHGNLTADKVLLVKNNGVLLFGFEKSTFKGTSPVGTDEKHLINDFYKKNDLLNFIKNSGVHVIQAKK